MSDPPGDGASAAARLGPLPVWAATAVTAASVGWPLGLRVAPHLGPSGAAGLTVTGPAPNAVAAAAVVAVLAVVAGSVRAVRRGSGVARGLAGVGLLVLVVGGGAATRAATLELGALPQLAARGGVAALSATVVAEPRHTAAGWLIPVRVTSLDGAATRERAAWTVADASLSRPPFDGQVPALGTRWVVSARAAPLPEGGYGRWLASQHLTVRLTALHVAPDGVPRAIARSTEHVRSATRTAALRAEEDPVGGLQVGIVTGDTRGLPDATVEALRATSLTHLVAVSGTHTAVVVGGVLLLLGACRAPARLRWVAAGVALLAFAHLTRFQPSVLRAGTMGGLLLAAALRGHARDALHALAGAVLLLVLLDPALATSVGLRLSAGATTGVLVIAPRVRDRFSRLPRRLATGVGVAVGAQLAVLPLLLTTFGEVPLASVPANVVAVPLAVLAMVVAFPAALLAAVHPAAGATLFAIGRPPAAGVLAVAEAMAGRGGVADVAVPITVLALAAGGVWLVTTPRSRSSRATAAVALVAVLATIAVPLVHRLTPVTTFAVTAIDVGQGDAFLLTTPGARVLVDAGEDDAAARWLARHGREALDLVIVTHGHLDHVGGVPDVLDTVDVGAVWRPPSPEPIAAVDRADRHADAVDVPVRVVTAPARAQVGDLHLEVLGPPPGRPYRHASSELNEASLVVRASWGDRHALVAGDVEEAAQRDLTAVADARIAAGQDDPLAVGLLTVPHHGSATTDPAFLARVGAPVGLISAGRDNRHGHPHTETLEALAAIGTVVHRTDLQGTVRVEVPARADRAAERGPPVEGPGWEGAEAAAPPARRPRQPRGGARPAAGGDSRASTPPIGPRRHPLEWTCAGRAVGRGYRARHGTRPPPRRRRRAAAAA